MAPGGRGEEEAVGRGEGGAEDGSPLSKVTDEAIGSSTTSTNSETDPSVRPESSATGETVATGETAGALLGFS